MTRPDDAPDQSIGTQATHGHRSALLSQSVRVGCKALSVVVLARLLTPADHGLYAMAASVFLFLFLLRDLGLGTAIVQAPALSETQLTTLFWSHALLGIAYMLLACAVAPLTARFYATPAAGPMLAVMAAAFFIIGLGGLPRALLARELRFRELNFVETAAAIIGTIVMISAGIAGAGAYAFVVYLLVSESTIVVLAWRACRWRPHGRPEWRSIRELVRTGLHLTGFHTLNYGLAQIDTFVVGRVFGAHTLGLYNRAGQLLALTNLHVAGPLVQVALSALSRLGSEAAEFRRQARETATLIAHLVLPVTTVCIALPDEVVRLVLGGQWPEAAPMLRWLAVNMGIFTVTSLAYSINVATGQSHRLVVVAFAALPFMALAIWLGLPHGAAGIAAALAVMNLLLMTPRLWWMLHGSPLTTMDFLSALAGPTAVSLALGAGLATGHALAADSSALIKILAAAAAGSAAVGVVMAGWPRVRAELSHVRTHLPWVGSPMTRPSV
jgi:O-antigen/teichoic acid export membrane protein